MLSWGVAILAWFYGIYEMFATNRMIISSYILGKKVLDFKEPFVCHEHSIRVNEMLETENGKFKFIQRSKCLFREKLKLFHLRWHTPFPLRGTLAFQDGIVHVEGRLPLGPTVFMASWAIGWTSGGIGFGIQEHDFRFAGLFILIGWLFLLIMYYMSVPLEKKRFLVVYEEVKQNLRCSK
ncbi:MAG TPA: hypothetical protein DEA95_06585 [Nitrospiraceae bacterium]|nr:hypothetical protein [Nitrospiraceae bacterium]